MSGEWILVVVFMIFTVPLTLSLLPGVLSDRTGQVDGAGLVILCSWAAVGFLLVVSAINVNATRVVGTVPSPQGTVTSQ